jgi:hypothetical protein
MSCIDGVPASRSVEPVWMTLSATAAQVLELRRLVSHPAQERLDLRPWPFTERIWGSQRAHEPQNASTQRGCALGLTGGYVVAFVTFAGIAVLAAARAATIRVPVTQPT